MLVTAIVVAPVAWVLLALGQERSTAAFADHSTGLQADAFVRPLLLLAAAGLLLGVLGTLRFSPLGAILIGILYTLSSAMLMVAPARVVDLFSDDLYVAGKHLDLAAPIRSGTTMVLGVLLLVGAVSVQRWRRWPRSAGADAPEAAMAADRPLGTEGLGLTPMFRDAEPEMTVRYPTTPAPYAPEPYEGEPWPEMEDDPRRATSASRAPYGW